MTILVETLSSYGLASSLPVGFGLPKYPYGYLYNVLLMRNVGLLSLTVEFFRITTSGCTVDNNHNNIIPNDYANFPYENVSCNLTCSSNSGPFSPLRQGSANEIYIIPAPNILTFNAATLLAAACCIPAVLSLVSMWNKILEINWKTKFGRGDEDQLHVPGHP